MGFLGERNRKLAPNWHRAIPAFFRLLRRRVRERPQTAETTKCDRRRPRVPHSVFLVVGIRDGGEAQGLGEVAWEADGATVNIEDTLFLRQETWARTQYTAPKQDQKWRARDLVDIHSCGHSLGIGGRADAVAQLQPNHVVHHRPCEPDNRPLTGETKLIAAETGYCVKTVSRAIDWWVAHGFLIEDIGLQSRGHIVHSGTSSSCIGLPSPRISKLGNRPGV